MGVDKIIPFARVDTPPTGYVIEASYYGTVLRDLYEARAQIDAAIASLENVRPSRRPKIVRKRRKGAPLEAKSVIK